MVQADNHKLTTWDTFIPELKTAIAKGKMNSIAENTAQKWLTKLWPVLLRELTLAECKPVDVTNESIEFTTKEGVKIRFKVTQL